MPLPAELFLALRYLRPKRTLVSVISLLSVLGPTLGVAIMLIVSSVMSGFDRDIREGIMSMQAHLNVYPRFSESFEDPLSLVAQFELYGVKSTPVIEGNALIQVRKLVLPKVVRGIIPELEKQVTAIQRNYFHPGHVLQEGEVVIGGRLASSIGLRVGDEILIHSPARLTKNVVWKDDGTVAFKEDEEVYLPEEVKVAGLYSMGVADYDDNVIIMHLDQAAELMGLDWGSATSIQIAVPDPMQMQQLQDTLKKNFPLCHFVSWQEKNKLLFGTLQVEKNLMTFLMTFIVLVASFCIATTLITVVVQKTREIGVLKAVGMSNGRIARIFLLQGGFIGLMGTGLGVALGLLVLAFRDRIANILSLIMGHEVFPAELYHLMKIPALTTCSDLLLIVTLSLGICILAALIPALYAASLQPAKALQEE
ncbi:MAG: ABC transporter permease [Oligosphaeraceae bacterium]|nr:ABC transporter permease [Oligosphaeraceae bacterium]